MIKLLWDLGNEFLSSDSREKLIIIFLFLLALALLFTLGEKSLNTIGIIIGGYLVFLRGSVKPIPPTSETTETTTTTKSETKEKEKENEEVQVPQTS